MNRTKFTINITSTCIAPNNLVFGTYLKCSLAKEERGIIDTYFKLNLTYMCWKTWLLAYFFVRYVRVLSLKLIFCFVWRKGLCSATSTTGRNFIAYRHYNSVCLFTDFRRKAGVDVGALYTSGTESVISKMTDEGFVIMFTAVFYYTCFYLVSTLHHFVTWALSSSMGFLTL
jgi:hypothetical protein